MMTAGFMPVVPDMPFPVAAGIYRSNHARWLCVMCLFVMCSLVFHTAGFVLSPEEVNAEIDRIHARKEAVLQQLSGGLPSVVSCLYLYMVT